MNTVSELVSTFDLNLWIQIDSVRKTIKSNSVGSGYVSHCWTSAFDDHFNHCFMVLNNVDTSELRRLRVRRNIIYNCSIEECRAGLESWFGFGCACLMKCDATSFPVLFLWISSIGQVKNGTLQSPHFKDPELESYPCVNLHRGK